MKYQGIRKIINLKESGRRVAKMDGIVKHGLKIDQHIHSCASASKDGNKVRNNTIEDIHLLIKNDKK